MLVAWTPLSPSRREQGLRRLAQVLGYSTAAVLLGAAFRDASVEPVPALGALVASVAGLLAGRRSPAVPLEIGVDDAGGITARRATAAGESVELPLRCVFAAPWLITLVSGTMSVRVWPDSVPGNIFRRLWVHVRWNPGRRAADRTGATAPVPPG
ncbi:MAG: hypothetical protein ACM3O5_12260 [Betaproteobacteria bacterium]